MTRVMTRLAMGITSGRVPSTHRPDEIGELARAFEVFRTNLLENERLAQGLDAQRRLQHHHDRQQATGFHERHVTSNT
ncbi:HAMP domain-containing protein [Burkholderia pyrrocinia]|uniref:HAMP domain-containing protein n=1 Tax=Burkholderia pyrrocinia TaxID=60550 RepID=UPI00201B94DE|nr:HAMP domain-containing protein [Burkholderia pyrrocinia]